MTHPREALSAFVDGELEGVELREVERHLVDCAACRDLAWDLRTIDSTAAAVAPPVVPADLAGRIRARLDATAADAIPASASVLLSAADRPRQPAKLWSRWMPLAAAASLLLAVLLWRARPERLPYRADQGQPVIAENAAPRENSQAPPALSAPPPAAPPAAGMLQAQSAEGTSSDVNKASGARRQDEKRKVAGDQPAATGSEKEELKSLGYLAAKPTETADGSTAHNMAEAAPAAGMTQATRVAPATTPSPSAAAAETAAPSLLRHRVAPSLIRADPYLIRQLEDRLVYIESGSYSCVVQVSEEDAAQIATLIKEAANAAKAAIEPENQEYSAVAIPAASPQARRVLLGMVRERYRTALEARCGPLPQ